MILRCSICAAPVRPTSGEYGPRPFVKCARYVCPSMGRARRTLVHTTCPTSLQVDNRLGVPVGTKLWKVTADESALSSKE